MTFFNQEIERLFFSLTSALRQIDRTLLESYPSFMFPPDRNNDVLLRPDGYKV